MAFPQGWNGTLICDDYKGYWTVFKLGERVEAGWDVHCRRKFDELIKHRHREVAAEAVRRLALRQQITRPCWDDLHAWLQLER